MSRDFRGPDDERAVDTTTTSETVSPQPIRVREVDRVERTNVETNNVQRPSWSTNGEASALLAARDSVRWGPIVAGLVTALTTFLLLSLLAVGIGLTAADPANGSTDTQTLGIGSAITGAIIGLVSFFIGGRGAPPAPAARGPPPRRAPRG